MSINKPEPTDEDIAALSDAIGDAVKNAIKDGVNVLEWLVGFGNMDDQIGSAVFRFSHNQLESAGPSGIPFGRRWENEGDWELFGHVSARALPRRDECCKELRGKVHELETQLKELMRRLQALERRLVASRVPSERLPSRDMATKKAGRRG